MPLRYIALPFSIKDSAISKKAAYHFPESRGERAVATFYASICNPVTFLYISGILSLVLAFSVTCSERMVIRRNDRFIDTLGFEAGDMPLAASHDGVTIFETSFLGQNAIPNFYLPDRFHSIGSKDQCISVKAGEAARKDIYFPFPALEIRCSDIGIALSIAKPII